MDPEPPSDAAAPPTEAAADDPIQGAVGTEAALRPVVAPEPEPEPEPEPMEVDTATEATAVAAAAPSAPPDSSLVCLSDHYFGNLHNFQCPRKDVGVTRRPPPRNFTDVGAAIGRREGGGSRRPLTWSDLYRYIKAAIGIRRQPPPPAWGCRRARRRVRRCYYVWR